MKIKKDIIVSFLEKIRMNEIEACVLEFGEKGLSVKAQSEANTHISNGLLYKEAFDEYEPIGNAGVDELSSLVKVLSRLGDEIEFKVEGNVFTAKGDKMEMQVSLVDEKFVDNGDVKDVTKFEYDNEFNVEPKTVKKFIKDSSANKEYKVVFETVDGGVKLYNTGKFVFTYHLDAEGVKSGCKTKFGKPFVQVMSNIEDGDVSYRIKSDGPLVVNHKTDDYEILFGIAPVVNDE